MSPNILIVRLSAVGDAVHGLPVLCALRDSFPRARLTWVVEERAAAVVRDHAALDRLITVPRGWLRNPVAVLRLRRELRRVRPEIALDLQGLTKSAMVAWLSGAGLRIGFARPEGRELSRVLNNRLITTSATHVVDRYLELLGPLGIARPSVRFDLPRHAEDEATVARYIRERGLGSGFAVINPGAGWPSKRWPVERLAAVARHLGQRRHLPTVVAWGGKEEWALADRIITTSAGAAHMAPQTTLGELAELARRARLFVSADTGPLHIAAAVGTPCVGLFGPMPAERNGPYGEQHIALQNARLEGSSRSRRTASDDSMRAISVEEVGSACNQILDRQLADRPVEVFTSTIRFPSATAA
ncbi:MAG TPA: glycosyltransferase family 9 protein [Pirellulales bacterium]|jgi:heptosyltransferase-1|nr:glycosyltransferase family 9 protein [Pirellulales bacterium]